MPEARKFPQAEDQTFGTTFGGPHTVGFWFDLNQNLVLEKTKVIPARLLGLNVAFVMYLCGESVARVRVCEGAPDRATFRTVARAAKANRGQPSDGGDGGKATPHHMWIAPIGRVRAEGLLQAEPRRRSRSCSSTSLNQTCCARTQFHCVFTLCLIKCDVSGASMSAEAQDEDETALAAARHHKINLLSLHMAASDGYDSG